MVCGTSVFLNVANATLRFLRTLSSLLFNNNNNNNNNNRCMVGRGRILVVGGPFGGKGRRMCGGGPGLVGRGHFWLGEDILVVKGPKCVAEDIDVQNTRYSGNSYD